tara:strand:+ start:134 stop:250 length:117 start_codon:yes stop_codon:yes gene_type:complete
MISINKPKFEARIKEPVSFLVEGRFINFIGFLFYMMLG